MIENMHDIPYLNTHVGPEITAAMTVIGYEVRKISELPCGIQILAAANTEALAVALAAGLQFVRVEGFVFAHVADEGLMNSCAGELLRYRKQIGAEHILVFTDIKKKHRYPSQSFTTRRHFKDRKSFGVLTEENSYKTLKFFSLALGSDFSIYKEMRYRFCLFRIF